MELIASFPTDSNYLTDMNMNFFSVVIGLALCLFLYLLIELIRLVRLHHYQRHLHDHRTPLSAGFDREQWGRFMLGALQREAALGRDHVRQFVESCFYDMPAEKLTRGDIDKWLRMYISVREAVDGELEPWARSLADAARDVVETSLGLTFPAGPATHKFERINHPLLDDHPLQAKLRPLPLVAGFLFVRTLGDLWLRYLGFERSVDEQTGFVFWRHQRRRTDSNQPRRAFLFISGLGHGQPLYPHHAYCFIYDAAFIRTYTDICLCELPGVSGTPLRDDATYPTARESVEAVERFASNILHLPSIDAVAHSAGGHLLSYASRYAPTLFSKAVYAEVPCAFFTHASKAWPFLFSEFNLPRLLKALLTIDLSHGVLNWIIMSEVHHQHVLKNATWYMETCHHEEPGTLGKQTMLIMGTEDRYVNGEALERYFYEHHPEVVIKLNEGWTHGSFWQPNNIRTVMCFLRGFLCGEEEEDGEVKELMMIPSPMKVKEKMERPATPTEKALQFYARKYGELRTEERPRRSPRLRRAPERVYNP